MFAKPKKLEVDPTKLKQTVILINVMTSCGNSKTRRYYSDSQVYKMFTSYTELFSSQKYHLTPDRKLEDELPLNRVCKT